MYFRFKCFTGKARDELGIKLEVVYMCVCLRACACVRARACVCACVCRRVCIYFVSSAMSQCILVSCTSDDSQNVVFFFLRILGPCSRLYSSRVHHGYTTGNGR